MIKCFTYTVFTNNQSSLKYNKVPLLANIKSTSKFGSLGTVSTNTS